MKKIILALIAVVFVHTSVLADNDTPITVQQLPVNARQFVEKHFADLKVSYAKKENDFFDKTYEVVFVDGSKIKFKKNGDWDEVSSKSGRIPAEIIPQKIQQYIQTNHPDNRITGIDLDGKKYELKLNNGLELTFNSRFELINYDD